MKITLTPQEYEFAISYIEKRNKGIMDDYMPTGPEDPMATLLDKAIKFQEDTNAFDEAGDNLLLWFINKYHQQEGKVPLR